VMVLSWDRNNSPMDFDQVWSDGSRFGLRPLLAPTVDSDCERHNRRAI